MQTSQLFGKLKKKIPLSCFELAEHVIKTMTNMLLPVSGGLKPSCKSKSYKNILF